VIEHASMISECAEHLIEFGADLFELLLAF
jgi:hypothetical protein